MTGFDGLRVGLIGPLPPPAGGMAVQTQQLCALLTTAGTRVTLIRTNAPYWPAWVGSVPAVRAVFRLVPYLVSLWRATSQCDLFHLMANSGWSWHLFAAPAIWVARARGLPIVVNYRGGEAASFLAKQERVIGFSLRRASRLIVPSGFLQEVFSHHGFAAEVVPNVVDLARFRPAPEKKTRIGHLIVTRNLEAIYDNATALRAFAIVFADRPLAKLTIAGIGAEESMLRQLAHDLGIDGRVHFSGLLDREAMAQLYRDADIALNPSLIDNTPNSVLEALGSGVPLVSTNVGGVPFIVRDGATGILVPPGDPAAMARAVLRLLENSELADRIAAAGLESVKRFTWDKVSGVLCRVYRNASSH